MPSQFRRRLPWAITLATLALWALSPGGWGRSALEGAPLPEWSGPVEQGLTGFQQALERELNAGVATGRDGLRTANAEGTSPECEPSPVAPIPPDASAGASASQAWPAPLEPLPTASPPPMADSGPAEALFRLCGATDPQAERAIEQLVAGRSFRATLIGLQDGCAELTITATGVASGAGRQSTNLTIGGGPGVSVRIVSENGSTRANIGPAS
jgi:hypothetical protein